MKRLLLFLPVLLLQACFEVPPPPDSLPPVTMSGENTFGMQVNGVNWVPAVAHAGLFALPTVEVVYHEGTFFLMVQRPVEGGVQQLVLDIDSVVVNETLFFDSENLEIDFYDYPQDCYYDLPIAGSITFSRLDTAANIAAATFEFFVASSDSTCATMELTEGRFDYEMDYYY